ncbi:MAG: hypothetical protein K8T20_00915, partial [Planctomycetes bacterium]|nr:hypothetical protein [Planctomycetota bacterium]
MIRKGMENNRGFVLLVALGVLGVLGLLAATFATLSRVERAVSNSYVDKVRAKMLAQSGVERAIASIRGRAMIQSWDDARNDWYYREMLNKEAGTLVYPAIVKSDIWKFTPTRAYGMPPRSLESALDDGLVNSVKNGVSFPQSIDPKNNEPFSGQFPGTYENRGDVYALKVMDCASMINVNDGGSQVVRMLNNLGSILKCADSTAVNAGGFNLGDQISAAAIKRAKPFNNKSEIYDTVFINNTFFSGNPADARKRFEACKDFITCHGWVDGMTTKFDQTWTGATDYTGGDYASAISSITKPQDAPTYAAAPLPAPAVASVSDPAASKGGSVDSFSASPLYSISAPIPGTYASLPSARLLAAAPVFMVKNADKGGGFKQFVTGAGATSATGGETAAGKFGGTYYYGEPRTPVNINTASREVIVATLMNLEADFWDYTVLSESAVPKEYNGSLGLINVKITQADAENIADYLISARFTNGTPAGAWSFNDWMHFEDDVILAIPGLTRFQRALIKANANPNTNVKKLDPDLILVTSNPSAQPSDLVRMDKSDVKVNSTEWTFSSNGIFEIEAIGRVYNAGKVMAEEKVETVVKVFDQVVYTTQEQFEKDRTWTTEDSKEGDLLAGGYPPVVSMPEYVYNAASNPVHYRSQTGDVSWCADYEGYMILNGPSKVQAGSSPGPAHDGDAAAAGYGAPGNPQDACWGPDPSLTKIFGTPLPPAGLTKCGISFVAGFNLASVYPNQSHRHAWHDVAGGFGSAGGGPRHPEYDYSSPHCFGDAASMSAYHLQSFLQDTGYDSGYGGVVLKPYQIEPTAADSGWSWGSSGGTGANFWDNGCDLQNFGIYINETRRNRFHTYWADEVPAPNCTIEMTVKPEIDIWTWVSKSKQHVVSNPWSGSYTVLACKRQFFFDWGVGSTKGMNYSVRAYAELTRVYIEFFHHPTGKFYVIWHDQSWKPHTWHHVEFSWVCGTEITKADGSKVVVPPNAMIFSDGACNTAGETSMSSPDSAGMKDVNTRMGMTVYGGAAICLPENVLPTNPNNDVGNGPRFDVGGILANDGSFGMSSPRWHGVIDNIVMHHWRSHTAPFSPRNRYHSATYYDDATWKSGEGYKKELSGVYKKRLTFLENEAKTKDVTIGTVGCSHYHPFHVHLYGHDGAAPTTSFGHITPSLRLKTGGSYVDSYYYDGCVGVPVKAQLKSGTEAYYLGWFEVASLVPVTMSPILCDIRITYFEEP